MIYSLAQDMPSQSSMFRPYDLDEDVTIENIIGNLQQSNYLSALLLALRMNEPTVLDQVFKSIPLSSVALLSANIPSSFVFRFMAFLQGQMSTGLSIEWNLVWLRELLKHHEGQLALCRQSTEYGSTAYAAAASTQRSSKDTHAGRALLLKVHQTLDFYDENLKRLVNENQHTMAYMLRLAEQKKMAIQQEESSAAQEHAGTAEDTVEK